MTVALHGETKHAELSFLSECSVLWLSIKLDVWYHER